MQAQRTDDRDRAVRDSVAGLGLLSTGTPSAACTICTTRSPNCRPRLRIPQSGGSGCLSPAGDEPGSGGPGLVQLPAVRFATRIGEALVWTAFALEFAVMIAVVDRKLKYCVKHWIDMLVIVLPLLAFLRSLQLARLVRLHQIGKFTRLYRLRGSVVRAQRGAVVASVVERGLCAIHRGNLPGCRTRWPRKSAISKPCAGRSAISNGKSSDKRRQVAAPPDARREHREGGEVSLKPQSPVRVSRCRRVPLARGAPAGPHLQVPVTNWTNGCIMELRVADRPV